ncbi:MAG: DUF354 domain-containing protein [Candidatus Nezhaarchaeota archaeon]|nr:DUF354 domain-containing protein [Candidatus Nezhaarchaeota archaeon]
MREGRVWVDVNTPKQVRFFSKLAERLEAKGLEVLVTARRYREVEQLAKLVGMKYVPVGAYGGPRLEDKLRASLLRAYGLLKLVEEWRPSLAISFSSPEAARVAYGLAVPHLCVNDSPHSEAVARLTVPLSAKLFTPKCIPIEKWTRYGISASNIVQYDAVDPAAWLKEAPRPSFERRRLIVARASEEYASYMPKGAAGGVVEVVEELSKRAPGFKIVVLARYEDQVARLRERLRGRAKVPARVVDGVELLSKACLFIGGGGTMTWEAALLGTPTVSFTPVEGMDVEEYMASLGLVRKARGVEEAVEASLEVLASPGEWVARQARRAMEVLGLMENPVDVLAKSIEEGFSRT